VEHVAPGMPVQVTAAFDIVEGDGEMVTVIVAEANEPAVTVIELGLAERLTVMESPALTGFTTPTTNSKIKPTENSKTLSLTKYVTKHHSPATHLRLDLEIWFTPWF